jgi:hypothetical protein
MATYQEPQQFLDAAPQSPNYQGFVNEFADLETASSNFWAGRTGRERPPAPTYRIASNGKRMLGRYMDPFGCQGHMRYQRTLWKKYYTEFFIAGGSSVLFLDISWAAIILIGPMLAARYFYVKNKHRKQYDLYYAIQDQILQTGEPQWVPYGKQRLKQINEDPETCWP